MQRSSANNPCPCCGRHKTSHCAWTINGTDEDTIFCHLGERWRPSINQIGETMIIEGRQWALTATGKGFSGNSHVLRPHKGLADPTFHLAPRHRKANADFIALEPIKEKRPDEAWQELRHKVKIAFDSNAQSIDRVETLLSLMEQCKSLLRQLRQAKRLDPTLSPYVEEATSYLRQICYEYNYCFKIKTNPQYAKAWGDTAPTVLVEPEPDWFYWQQQKALPTHPWVLQCKASGEKFWYPVEGDQ